jgi:hypothetical protein
MIITDIKEIYEKIEVGDTLTVGDNYFCKKIITGKVIDIKLCKQHDSMCMYGCSKYIYLEGHDNHCFQYGNERCIIKSLSKKEGFIKKEEMML